MKFGEVSKARRLELGLTQDELSEMAGTNQQQITKVETYGMEPKFIVGCSILVALELDPMEVFKQLRLP
ncbi:MAG: helix-turn-helix transcriptional regulator [Actinomycetia bacterium]|nr:helix-turn-helix transcriptional regulator [Actinomycetes bacterium]